MDRSARITSIDVLQTVACGLQKFRGEASSALDDLDIELHRVLEWIHNDRREHWTRELQLSERQVGEARAELLQAQAVRKVGNRKPSCVDEQKALERAKRRQRNAEEKIKALRVCAHAIDRAVEICRRERTLFAGWLDSDVQKAITLLNRMSDSLEDYVSLEAPVNPHAPVALSMTDPQNEQPDVKTVELGKNPSAVSESNVAGSSVAGSNREQKVTPP